MGCIHKNEIICREMNDKPKDDPEHNSKNNVGVDDQNNSKNNKKNQNEENKIKSSEQKKDQGSIANISSNELSEISSNNNKNINDKDLNSSLISDEKFSSKYKIISEIKNENLNKNIKEYKIQSKTDPSIFRVMRKILKTHKNEEKQIITEYQWLQTLDHKHITKLYGCYLTDNNCYLVSEFFPEGSLEDKLKWSIHYTESQIRYLAFQLFGVIKYLNKKNFMHTDIKPKNIMISEIIKNDIDEDLYNIKLSEFSSYDDVNSNNNNLPYYTAPEVFDKKYDSTCDVWSVGVIMYQMYYGELPFGGDTQNEKINC